MGREQRRTGTNHKQATEKKRERERVEEGAEFTTVAFGR